MRIAVLGATGKTGRYLVTRLCRDGDSVVAISRSTYRLAGIDSCADKRQADILETETIRAALADADCVVSLAHARFTAALLPALPSRCRWVVLTGSVRRSTALPDPAADAVRDGEATFARWRASGGKGVMLHPGMIYGAREDRNVGRLVRLLRAWPRFVPVIVPLPDGGTHTVQPVYFEDLVASIVAAIRRAPDVPPEVEVVGPVPISYRTLVQETAAAVGRRAWIVPVPLGLLTSALAVVGRLLPLPFSAVELRRGTESKRFDPGPMRVHLGVDPRPFANGVREKVSRGWF